jgi:hypothetical protein
VPVARARPRAYRRRHPPRHQAGEHLPRPALADSVDGDGARLRHREGAVQRSHDEEGAGPR